MIKIREYRSSDCEEITRLFYDTVHTVNTKDYTKEQLDAWAPENVDITEWDRSFREHFTLVAVADGMIAGFGDIDETGYLDRLYVHRDFQGQGIAGSLCYRLEAHADGKITTHASITAKPFFISRGYRVIKKQEVVRRGIKLTNYVMEKEG